MECRPITVFQFHGRISQREATGTTFAKTRGLTSSISAADSRHHALPGQSQRVTRGSLRAAEDDKLLHSGTLRPVENLIEVPLELLVRKIGTGVHNDIIAFHLPRAASQPPPE